MTKHAILKRYSFEPSANLFLQSLDVLELSKRSLSVHYNLVAAVILRFFLCLIHEGLIWRTVTFLSQS